MTQLKATGPQTFCGKTHIPQGMRLAVAAKAGVAIYPENAA